MSKSALITPPSGAQYTITCGGQVATIAAVGAMVRMYQAAARNVFVPFNLAEPAPVYNAAILAPWPNRLADGAFEFHGFRGNLGVNEVGRMNNLHGLVCWAPWQLVEHRADAASLTYDLPAQPGWPYQLRFTVTYQLSAAGLRCELDATNIGTATAPYGVGFHPWLDADGAPLDECEVQLTAADHVVVSERLLPTGTEPVAGPFDLREFKPLRGLDLDDAWLQPIYDDDGLSWCRLRRPDGTTIGVWADRSLPAWQVCTADHIPGYRRFGLAAEPMSCVADAFNTGDLLVELAPGQTHTVQWGAGLLEAR